MSNQLVEAVLTVNKTPLEEPCRKCGNKALVRLSSLLGGPYGGVVTCSTEGCDFRETVYSYLGRSMFKIEPMPEGAKEYFLPDSEDKP